MNAITRLIDFFSSLLKVDCSCLSKVITIKTVLWSGSHRVTDFLVRGKNTGQLRIIEVKTGGAT